MARAFPDATVYVHEKGARHLADPTRLVDSAARVYGPLLDSLYGRLDPTPPERLHVLADGEEIGSGPTGCSSPSTRPATPSTTSACTTRRQRHPLRRRRRRGEAARRRGAAPGDPPARLRPRPGAALARALRRAPARPGIALAHYGLLGDPLDLLAEAEETLRRWADVAEQAYRNGEDIAAALSARFDFQTWTAWRPRPAREARDHERRPLERGRDAPLARAPRRPARPEGEAGPRRSVDLEPAAQLFLADLEVLDRDAPVGQVLVEAGELLEERRLVLGRTGGAGSSADSALSSRRARRSSCLAFALARLAWSRWSFPKVDRGRAMFSPFERLGPGVARSPFTEAVALRRP